MDDQREADLLVEAARLTREAAEAARVAREAAEAIRRTDADQWAEVSATELLEHACTLQQVRASRALAGIVAEAKRRGEYPALVRDLAAEGITVKDLRRAMRLPPVWRG